MRRRGPGRYVAPLVLLLVVVAVVTVVSGSLKKSTPAARSPAVSRLLSRRGPVSKRHFWIVRSGQTLSHIAIRTGISVADIKRLNPKADLRTLRPGQFLKVR